MLARYCALFHLLLVAIGALARTPIHRRLTMAEGLPSNSVYMTLQDRQGFIWFATDAGVSRYDGRSFRNYGLDEGLPDTDILRLHEDSRGRIWCLGFNGRLAYLLDGKVYSGETDPALAKLQCTSGCQSMVEDRHGVLWIGGVRSELLRLDIEGGADATWHWGSQPISVSLDHRGEVRVIMGRSVMVQRAGEWVVTDDGKEQWDRDFSRAASSGAHGGLAISHRGVERVVNDRWSHWLPLSDSDPERYQNCWMDDHGVVWVRYWRGGVLRIRPGSAGKAATRHRIFPDEAINHVFTDRDQNVWFATARNGVKLCSPGQELTAVYRTRKAPFEVAFLDLHLDHAGGIWVGTALGQVFRFNGDGLGEDLGWQQQRGMGRVLSLDQRGEDVFYAGSDNGTYRLGPGEREFMPMTQWNNTGNMVPVKDMDVDDEGDLWVAGFGLHTTRGVPGAKQLAFVPTMLDNTRIHRVVCMPDGGVYFTVHERLYHYRDGVDGEVAVPGLGPKSTITGLRSDAEGNLLVATSDRGVLRRKGNEWIPPLSTGSGLVSDRVRTIRQFGDTLVLCTQRGVQVLLMEGVEARRSWHLGTYSMLATEQANDAWLVNDRLFVATANGLCEVPFPPPEGSPFMPAAHLAGVMVDGVPRTGADPLVLALGERLDVAVYALDYAPLKRPEFQYRLGKDQEWADAETGHLSFPGLKAGKHRLAVRVRRSEGEWSDPLDLALTVVPPWYDHPLLRLVVLLVVLAAAVMLVRSRLKARYARDLLLEKQRTALNEERRRISADVHDDLGAELSNVLMHARVAAGRMASETDRLAMGKVTGGIVGTIARIDEVIWSLDPARDTLQATVDFIEQQAADYLEGHGIAFRTAVRVSVDQRIISAHHRREVWLIMREALRNVVKHAGAATVSIAWSDHGNDVELEMEDDGVGISDPPTSGMRQGLRNMERRAEKLGAIFAIGPRPTGGTRLRLVLPAGILQRVSGHEAGGQPG